MIDLLFVIAAFAVYSCTCVFTKLASTCSFMSAGYIAYMAGAVMVLGIYAVMWQKVLERMPLKKAFPYKSISLIFVLLISYAFFDEQITACNLLGIALISTGLVVMTLKKDTE